METIISRKILLFGASAIIVLIIGGGVLINAWTKRSSPANNTAGGSNQSKPANNLGVTPSEESAKIPDNFPSNIPLNPGATITAVTYNPDHQEALLSQTIQGTKLSVQTWYREQVAAKGWTVTSDSEQGLKVQNSTQSGSITFTQSNDVVNTTFTAVNKETSPDPVSGSLGATTSPTSSPSPTPTSSSASSLDSGDSGSGSIYDSEN